MRVMTGGGGRKKKIVVKVFTNMKIRNHNFVFRKIMLLFEINFFPS